MVRMDANVMLNTKWACHVDFDNFHIDWMKGKRKDEYSNNRSFYNSM
jgi:hypothetical protein